MTRQFIDRETFDHLGQLAALELDETQAEYLMRELNNQLSAIQELAAIPVDPDLPASLHGIPYSAETSPGLRPDEWHPFPTRTRFWPRPGNGRPLHCRARYPHTTLE